MKINNLSLYFILSHNSSSGLNTKENLRTEHATKRITHILLYNTAQVESAHNDLYIFLSFSIGFVDDGVFFLLFLTLEFFPLQIIHLKTMIPLFDPLKFQPVLRETQINYNDVRKKSIRMTM